MGKSGRSRGNAAPSGPTNSDEELLKRRAIIIQYEKADWVLGGVSWALTMLSVIWFLYFGQGTPTWLPADPVITLFGCSMLSTQLCRSSPRASWSTWRKIWHLLWMPSFAAMGGGFAQIAMNPLKAFAEHGWNYPPVQPMTVWTWTLSCISMCIVILMTIPKAPCVPKPSPDAPIAKVLFLLDALYGLAAAALALITAEWRKGLSPQGAIFAAVPFAMWGLGTGMCRSAPEMLGSIPATLLIHSGAVCRVVMFQNGGGLVTLCISSVLIVSHLALFLPLPLKEPDSNIFYLHRLKFQQWCYRTITNPVSGYGDEGDGAD